jgi:pre-rRNA-processing protein IPI3
MLTETLVASVLSSERAANTKSNNGAGIYVHEYQPLPSLKSTFKKSSTKPNCLVVTASHVFAAQEDKAVINVYNREKGNQEALVPFPEKISSIGLVGDFDGPGILAMGMEGGRVIFWEVSRSQTDQRPRHL